MLDPTPGEDYDGCGQQENSVVSSRFKQSEQSADGLGCQSGGQNEEFAVIQKFDNRKGLSGGVQYDPIGVERTEREDDAE